MTQSSAITRTKQIRKLMKKIISLFKRNYQGDRLVYDEVVEGAEWVQRDEGIATVKYDGTCCMMKSGKLYKRYDRKRRKGVPRSKSPFDISDFKDAPEDWVAAQDPDLITGHWPGWLPVGDGPEDKYHREAIDPSLPDGTYELCGPKISSGKDVGVNPEDLPEHSLLPHGKDKLDDVPTTFNKVREWLSINNFIEGIVWHHPDGRMVKIKCKDFGIQRRKFNLIAE